MKESDKYGKFRDNPVCEFGWKAVDFDLLGVDGKRYNLASATGENGLLIMFICNHCPYVKAIQDRLVRDVNAFKTIWHECNRDYVK